jgi:uncharacterized SAM-binding protein YcdF (DUF218 family)
MYYATAALLRPLLLVFLAAFVGLLLVWRRYGRKRLVFLTIALALLAAACLPVSSYYALGSLEWSYPRLEKRPNDAAAIVVLAGSIRPSDHDKWQCSPGTDTLYRCLRAAELYRATPCPIVVSGGKVHDSDPLPPAAEVMRDFLLSQGVDSGDLIVETRSRTTYENALECARILADKDIHRVVLVSDAAHLRRAVGCFRKQGIDTVPCGCRYRATGRNGGVADFLPDGSAAAGVEEAAHEWLGLAWYWLTNRI